MSEPLLYIGLAMFRAVVVLADAATTERGTSEWERNIMEYTV